MSPDLIAGLTAACQPGVLAFLMVGISLGAVFGALPGLTATMGVAVLTPLTFWLTPEQGLAMLLGIYAGAIPAGGIPAVLINVPGTPASIAAAWDGYPMAQQGRAGLALGINALMSGAGQLISILFLAVAAFPMAALALSFGPAEYFGMALWGLSLIGGVSGKHVLKGLIAGTLGLALATVGLDPMTAYPRFTFGISDFLDGISFIPVMIGLFGFAEVLTQIADRAQEREKPVMGALGSVFPSLAQWKQMLPHVGLSSIIGTIVGVIPAAGGDVGAIVAWEQSRRISREKQTFGKGSIEGLAASCVGANSSVGGGMATMLTLGIPGDSVSAVFIGALLIHGIEPGPMLFQNNQTFVFTMVWLMTFGAIIGIALGLIGARPLAKVLRIPSPWLWVSIMLFSIIGSYALNNAVADVWAMFVAGIIGFLLRRVDVPVAPLVLGLILGPIMEANLRRALVLSRGDWIGTLSRPIVLFFFVATALSLLAPLYNELRSKRGKT